MKKKANDRAPKGLAGLKGREAVRHIDAKFAMTQYRVLRDRLTGDEAAALWLATISEVRIFTSSWLLANNEPCSVDAEIASRLMKRLGTRRAA